MQSQITGIELLVYVELWRIIFLMISTTLRARQLISTSLFNTLLLSQVSLELSFTYEYMIFVLNQTDSSWFCRFIDKEFENAICSKCQKEIWLNDFNHDIIILAGLNLCSREQKRKFPFKAIFKFEKVQSMFFILF